MLQRKKFKFYNEYEGNKNPSPIKNKSKFNLLVIISGGVPVIKF